jgi:hypothetical protein
VSAGFVTKLAALRQTDAALHRLQVQRRRLEQARARHDAGDWRVKRRERTRQLIELGGLVAKAGLVELTDDDRAILYGALLEVAARLRCQDGDRHKLLWQRRGRRAFAEDALPS